MKNIREVLNDTILELLKRVNDKIKRGEADPIPRVDPSDFIQISKFLKEANKVSKIRLEIKEPDEPPPTIDLIVKVIVMQNKVRQIADLIRRFKDEDVIREIRTPNETQEGD